MPASESLLSRSIDVWNAGDWQTLESMWNPDGEIVAPEGWPEAGVFSGWPAIREQFERVKDSWAEEHIELISQEQAGDRLLSHIRWTVRGEASGAPLEVEMWMLSEFRDERFSRIEYFQDGEAARSAFEQGGAP